MDRFINLQWDTQVTAQEILEAIWEGSGDVDYVEVVEYGGTTIDDYHPGRVRVFLDEDACIWQIKLDD